MKNIAVLVGSLRKESWNKRLAKELIRIAPKSMDLNIVSIADLGLFNDDLVASPPESWTVFRDGLRTSDGILFVSPEYNRSIPGVLKNAIDIATRPPTDNVLLHKPVAVITASGTGIGGALCNEAIRNALFFSKVRMLPRELYIGQMQERFQEDEKTLVPDTEDFLKKVLVEFEEWIALFSKPSE